MKYTNLVEGLLAYTKDHTGPLAAAMRSLAADLTEAPWHDAAEAQQAWADDMVVDALSLRAFGLNPELRQAAVALLETLHLTPGQMRHLNQRCLFA